MLHSGWSPERVHASLVDRFRDEDETIPSKRAIERYRRRHVPPAAVLPASLIKDALNGLRYRVDTLALMDNVIWAQEQRVARLWQQEHHAETWDRHLDDAMQSLLEYLRERHRIAMELGAERAAGPARVGLHQSQALELPESHFQEILGILRRRQEYRETALGGGQE